MVADPMRDLLLPSAARSRSVWVISTSFADGSRHKNLSGPLRAFALLKHGRRLQLIVVGQRQRQGRRVLDLIERHRLGTLVKLTGS
jgi:hypothetical protein